MKKSINKKQEVSICSTLEARGSGHAWLGNDLDGSDLSKKKPVGVLSSSSTTGHTPPKWLPHLRRGSSYQRNPATEVLMEAERANPLPQQGDMMAAASRTGHKHVRSYYNAIKHLPRKGGVMDEVSHHISMLENLDAINGNMYYTEKDEFYVDEWSIKTPEIYHRHKELGTYMTMDGMSFIDHKDADKVHPNYYHTHIQWDAANGLCGLCGEQMSGEIMMMHKFYQF